jgi:hypothetical protein
LAVLAILLHAGKLRLLRSGVAQSGFARDGYPKVFKLKPPEAAC